MAVSLAAVALAVLAPLVAGHGSVLYPPSRNAIDSQLEPWKSSADNVRANKQFPMTGHWKYMPFGCDCSNGTEPCEAGQGCFWFSQVRRRRPRSHRSPSFPRRAAHSLTHRVDEQGCTIGCKECDGNGARVKGGRNVCNTTMKPTLNDPKYRTSGRNVPAGSPQDSTKYMPWRSPGNAPVSDPW
jgi:hypothetical protein